MLPLGHLADGRGPPPNKGAATAQPGRSGSGRRPGSLALGTTRRRPSGRLCFEREAVTSATSTLLPRATPLRHRRPRRTRVLYLRVPPRMRVSTRPSQRTCSSPISGLVSNHIQTKAMCAPRRPAWIGPIVWSPKHSRLDSFPGRRKRSSARRAASAPKRYRRRRRGDARRAIEAGLGRPSAPGCYAAVGDSKIGRCPASTYRTLVATRLGESTVRSWTGGSSDAWSHA
jgi:hypothetical protein